MSFNDSNVSVCKLPTSTVYREGNDRDDRVQLSPIIAGEPGALERQGGEREQE